MNEDDPEGEHEALVDNEAEGDDSVDVEGWGDAEKDGDGVNEMEVEVVFVPVDVDVDSTTQAHPRLGQRQTSEQHAAITSGGQRTMPLVENVAAGDMNGERLAANDADVVPVGMAEARRL